MDALLTQLAAIGGLPAIMLGFMILAVGYLYKRVEALQKENVDTLKAILPLMEKAQNTFDATLRALSKKGNVE
jgi:hypothetical protein